MDENIYTVHIFNTNTVTKNVNKVGDKMISVYSIDWYKHMIHLSLCSANKPRKLKDFEIQQANVSLNSAFHKLLTSNSCQQQVSVFILNMGFSIFSCDCLKIQLIRYQNKNTRQRNV